MLKFKKKILKKYEINIFKSKKYFQQKLGKKSSGIRIKIIIVIKEFYQPCQDQRIYQKATINLI